MISWSRSIFSHTLIAVKTVLDLQHFSEAEILDLAGSGELVLRLSELGFTKGEVIRIVGQSLFKSPIYVEVRGALIALRRSEAKCILIRN